MPIRVIGSGCATCKKLHELTEQAVTQLGMSETVTYSTDIQEIIAMGVMQSPVLAIGNRPVLIGKVFDIEKIKHAIKSNTP